MPSGPTEARQGKDLVRIKLGAGITLTPQIFPLGPFVQGGTALFDETYMASGSRVAPLNGPRKHFPPQGDRQS